MTEETIPKTWRGVRAEVLRRIQARVWKPGEVIPTELELAAELDCARTTVNRALRDLADTGIVERRRKSGTRVAVAPVGRAVLEIPFLRDEIAGTGAEYAYRLVRSGAGEPGQETLFGGPAWHVLALHSGDAAPYVVEDRWINLDTVPQAAQQDFSQTSANAFLLHQVPYTRGDLDIGTAPAPDEIAALLGVDTGTVLLVADRRTFDEALPITSVRLWYPPGHLIRTALVG